jgi:hypothetical protein
MGTKNTAVFTFGRFNPPTIGHQKLLEKLYDVATDLNADKYIFLSFSKDKKKNPLGHYDKVSYMKEMFPIEMSDYDEPREEVRTPLDAALYLKDYHNIVVVTGSDRVENFTNLFNRYNGKEMKKGTYYFDSITVVSAGERDPNAKGTIGMSGTKLRDAVRNKDFEEFKKGMPTEYHGEILFSDLMKKLNIK